MTRFVTGGAGFIGANFLFYLRERYPDDRLVCIQKIFCRLGMTARINGSRR